MQNPFFFCRCFTEIDLQHNVFVRTRTDPFVCVHESSPSAAGSQAVAHCLWPTPALWARSAPNLRRRKSLIFQRWTSVKRCQKPSKSKKSIKSKRDENWKSRQRPASKEVRVDLLGAFTHKSTNARKKS